MSSKLKQNWMAEVSAGALNESPAIGEILYEHIRNIPINQSLDCIFKGNYLRKWRRSVPLTSINQSKNPEAEDPDVISKKKIYSSQSKGKSHERFFWVSQVCDTLFLRWYSRRKRSSETIFPLCTIKTIHRADELTYFDKNDPFDGVNLKQIFVINGRYSLQLATESDRDTLLWISGLYFASRYSRNQYSINWITNSELFRKFLITEKKQNTDPDHQFNSNHLKMILNDKYSSLLKLGDYDYIRNFDDTFQLPLNISHLIQFMEYNEVLSRPEHIDRITTLIRRLLDYRNKINNSFVQMTAGLDKNMKPTHIIKFCMEHLKSLNVDFALFQDELIMLYPLLTEEETQELFYNIVRQCALKIIINTTNGKNTDYSYKIPPQDYELFLKCVQSSDLNEITTNLVSIKDVLKPFTYIIDEEPILKSTSCFRKIIKPRIPVRFLTLLGLNWSLTRKFNDICIPQDSEEIISILSLNLGEFWISSSHNTYLTGDQLGGSATASALSEALLRGCRCIELDCQDGDDEPVLCHSWKNYHLTGSVTLREGLIAIKYSAFKNSRLPVILSFEMHCSDESKLKAYEIIKEILRDDLFTLDDTDSIDLVSITEIGSLLEKFIIKSKYKSSESKFYGPGETSWQSLITLRGIDIDTIDEKNLDKIKSNTVFAISESKFLKMSKNSKLIQDLCDRCFVRVYPAATRLASTNFCPIKPWKLGVQMVALNFQSYDRSMLLNHGRFYNSQGYVPKLIYYNKDIEEENKENNNNNKDNKNNENNNKNKKDKNKKKNKKEKEKYNDIGNITNNEKIINNDLHLRIHILSGTQIPSPNGFSEQNYINSFKNILYSIGEGGCQLDMSNLKSGNGTKLKDKKKLKTAIESGLIVNEEDEKSTLFEIIDKSSKIVLEYGEKVCPYVEVSVVGQDEKTYKTKPVNFNSFNPVWSDSNPPFDFKIKNPNQAIILFYVKNFDTISSETIGQAAFPVNRIRPGVRWVQLLDSKFMEIECCGLLVHVEMKYM